jgi:hypothetical protein
VRTLAVYFAQLLMVDFRNLKHLEKPEESFGLHDYIIKGGL